MNQPIFIAGIGTDVGKTLVSAIVTEALVADYWKPIQAGVADGTDAKTVKSLISNTSSVIHPATYELETPASPHIAARIDGVKIEISKLFHSAQDIQFKIGSKTLIVEGAGGLLVPLYDNILLVDFIRLLQARVILVSRNYLGSINHSLLTAAFCRSNEIEVLGWIFTDTYMDYEDEIVQWSGYPKIASIPKLTEVNKDVVAIEAQRIKQDLGKFIVS
ncbi:MAG: dethiobiotin synthase [Ignavibacteria bacterium]|nr:dethiobiotin synthase [Ignavibacteria bacterium]